jgi:cation transport ATPase
MEQDNLRSAWQGMATTPKTNAEIKNMMQENGHPVLKGIRKQLIIEIIAFTALLFVYYDIFDGDQKPLYANVLLVLALLFLITHNIFGYVLTKWPVKGTTIKQSLMDQLSKIKTYAVVSVAGRALASGCLLIFFTAVITFNAGKVWMLTAIILVFIVQIGLLARIWMKRIRKMKGAIESF